MHNGVDICCRYTYYTYHRGLLDYDGEKCCPSGSLVNLDWMGRTPTWSFGGCVFFFFSLVNLNLCKIKSFQNLEKIGLQFIVSANSYSWALFGSPELG